LVGIKYIYLKINKYILYIYIDMDYTEEQIKKILESHKNRTIKNKERYDSIKDTDEFKALNRERAKKYYYKGGNEKKKINYNKNRDVINAKQCYSYYKNINKIELFKTRHIDKHKLLTDINFIKDETQ